MTEVDTEKRTIEVKGRTYEVQHVSEAQAVVMMRLEAEIRRLGRTVPDIESDPTALRRAQSLATRSAAVVAGCFANPEDWDEIEELMALQQITWQEVLDIITQAAAAFSPEPENRAAKRAAAKKATRTVTPRKRT